MAQNNPFDNIDARLSNSEAILSNISTYLCEIKTNLQPKAPPEYLTRSEVAELLKCDLSTLWSWTRKGKLKAYGLGARVYYLRSEIESALTPLNA